MKTIAVMCAVMCAFVLVAALNLPVGRASITNYNWINTVARNQYDEFYGTFVTAYEENTSALLVVGVSNDVFSVPLNVSAVKVGFDWGVNYSSTECSPANPLAIPSGQSYVFTINFTVPSVYLASNLVTHGYTIYVEAVNSTTGPTRVVYSWTTSGNDFAVFSTDQASAYEYEQELNAYPTSNNGIPFLSANARQLLQESNVAKTLGGESYSQGDFSAAATYYQSALDELQQAWSNETSEWTTVENAITSLLQGGGNLLTMQGYAWLLFAVGFLLMSFGVLIYLTRKRTLPPPPKQP